MGTSVAQSLSARVDSLWRIVETTKDDSIAYFTAKSIYLLYLSEDKNYFKISKVGEQMIKIGKRSNNLYYQGVGHRLIADYYHHVGKYSEATNTYMEAIVC